MSDTTPATLSPEELEAIRQRHAKATPGKWYYVASMTPEEAGVPNGAAADVVREVVPADDDGPAETESIIGEIRDCDFEFIAESRQDVPALLAHAAALTRELEAARAELAEMERRKDAAYFERNQVVAALAKCFPGGVAKTAIEGWSDDWHGCVYIDLPTGQASWHFHDSQAHLFAGLPAYTKAWDGHDTDEKYRRLSALSPPPSPPPGTESEAQVRRLPWKRRDEKDRDLFGDGDQILAAVPLRGGGYDFGAVTVRCGENYFALTIDGDNWGWEWSDVEKYIPLDSSSPTPAAATPAPAGEAWTDLRDALSPVLDWYQPDDQHLRPLLDIVADAVADLQRDRQENLKMFSALRRLRDAGNADKGVEAWMRGIIDAALPAARQDAAAEKGDHK